MRAVDSNVLVRLIALDNPRQVESGRTFVERGAWVSVLALAEAAWVLGTVYQRSPTELASIIEMLLNQENLVIQDADAVVPALALFRKHPSLGFSDCLLLELARKAGHLPLGTFDRKLAKIEGAQLL
jgi:predicted nucleic-acid-binding protein